MSVCSRLLTVKELSIELTREVRFYFFVCKSCYFLGTTVDQWRNNDIITYKLFIVNGCDFPVSKEC